MAKGKIGFVQDAPVDKLGVKDSWDKEISNATVTYSTEGVVGVGFNHNCDIKRGDLTLRVTTIQTTEQLTRDEVERRFALAAGVSEYISEVSGRVGRT